jgi:hypothetical protein
VIALLGWLGSGLVVVSLLQRDIHRLRQVNLAAAAALGVFNVAVGIGSMIALDVVLAGVNGFHLLRGRTVARRIVSPPVDRMSTHVPGASEAPDVQPASAPLSTAPPATAATSPRRSSAVGAVRWWCCDGALPIR